MKKSAKDMLYIEKSNEGRRDGGYTRIFNDEDLGALLSRVQATVISSGNSLEKMLHAKKDEKNELIHQFDNIDQLRDFSTRGKLMAISISQLKKNNLLPKKGESIKKQDMYLIDNTRQKLYLVEIKDGDTFDTKKASGEIEALEIAKSFYSSKNSFFDYEIIPIFMSFNQSLNKAIYEGSKKIIPFDYCMTGKEFCKLIDIDFAEIKETRKVAAKSNKKFFIDKMLEIIRKYQKK